MPLAVRHIAKYLLHTAGLNLSLCLQLIETIDNEHALADVTLYF